MANELLFNNVTCFCHTFSDKHLFLYNTQGLQQTDFRGGGGVSGGGGSAIGRRDSGTQITDGLVESMVTESRKALSDSSAQTGKMLHSKVLAIVRCNPRAPRAFRTHHSYTDSKQSS